MKTLTVRNLVLVVDAYEEDPIEEARAIVRRVNNLIGDKLGGDPLLDFDLGGSADIEAEYVEEPEDA